MHFSFVIFHSAMFLIDLALPDDEKVVKQHLSFPRYSLIDPY